MQHLSFSLPRSGNPFYEEKGGGTLSAAFDGSRDSCFPHKEGGGETGEVQGCQPLGTKNAPSTVKKIPNLSFYYVWASEKMPDTQKGGIFFKFCCIFIDKGKGPVSEKIANSPRKAFLPYV